MSDELSNCLALQERLDSLEYRVRVQSKRLVYPDVPRQGAAQMYRKYYHGCRDLWKENYRRAAELPAKYTVEGKFPHKCKACGEFFYTYRPDAQTCSAKCRKAFSRSAEGHMDPE